MVRLLAADWALEAADIRYLPTGAGSYHWAAHTDDGRKFFLTVDDLDTKPWLADRREATFPGLRAAYEAAWALHYEAGLTLVVAPLRSSHRSVSVRLSGQYSLAVFPWVEGRTGEWGDALSDGGRVRLLRELATLHQATSRLRCRVARRPLQLWDTRRSASTGWPGRCRISPRWPGCSGRLTKRANGSGPSGPRSSNYSPAPRRLRSVGVRRSCHPPPAGTTLVMAPVFTS